MDMIPADFNNHCFHFWINKTNVRIRGYFHFTNSCQTGEIKLADLMKKLFVVFICLSALHLIAQENQNPRMLHKNGVVLSVGGPGVYGSISYENFISPTTHIEVGVGPATIFGGIRYHVGGNKSKSWTPYIGGYGVYIWLFEVFEDDDNESPIGAYIPFGFHYIDNKGISLSFEVAGLAGAGDVLPFGSFKAGYHF
jgi:hypothetical protein